MNLKYDIWCIKNYYLVNIYENKLSMDEAKDTQHSLLFYAIFGSTYI